MVKCLGGTLMPGACAPSVWQNVRIRAMVCNRRRYANVSSKGPSNAKKEKAIGK